MFKLLLLLLVTDSKDCTLFKVPPSPPYHPVSQVEKAMRVSQVGKLRLGEVSNWQNRGAPPQGSLCSGRKRRF